MVLAESAKSCMRCRPIQIVFGPGGPSLFLPIYPPKDASISTNGFNIGAYFGGFFPSTIAYTDFHSWYSKIAEQLISGADLANISMNITRHAIII